MFVGNISKTITTKTTNSWLRLMLKRDIILLFLFLSKIISSEVCHSPLHFKRLFFHENGSQIYIGVSHLNIKVG